MNRNLYRAALLLTAAARMAHAGQSHIHDILPANADGTLATGSVVLSWPTFSGTDTVLVKAGRRAVAINNGILDVTLAANPAGVNYTAIFYLGAKTLTQTWHVPDSNPVLTLANIIVVPAMAPGALTGAYKVDPSGIAPSGGVPGQVLTLNSLLQWAPARCALRLRPGRTCRAHWSAGQSRYRRSGGICRRQWTPGSRRRERSGRAGWSRGRQRCRRRSGANRTHWASGSNRARRTEQQSGRSGSLLGRSHRWPGHGFSRRRFAV